MTWTDLGWRGFTHLLEHGWPGEFGDDARAAWRVLLDDVEPDEAVAALRSLLREGGTFRPSASELRGVVERMRSESVPSFDEAWRVISVTMSSGNALDDDWALERIEASAGKVAAAWCSAYGLERLRGEPVNDPDHGGAVVRRLSQSYVEMTGSVERRDRLVLRLGEPKRQGLRRFDPAGLIGGAS